MITENEIATKILDICFKIHRRYDPGLFESVYEEILCYELIKDDIEFKRQYPIPLIHEPIRLEAGFRADLIIKNKVLIELKSIEMIAPVHKKQVQTYLKLTGLRLGLLINFNVDLLKEGITRIANNL